MDANRQLSADTDSPGVDLLGMARRHWWLVLLMVGAGLLGAGQFTGMQKKVYESATSVLVSAARQRAGRQLDQWPHQGRHQPRQRGAARHLHHRGRRRPRADAGRGQRRTSWPAACASRCRRTPRSWSSRTPPGDARIAQAGSHAFAEAYLRNREESAKAEVDRADRDPQRQAQPAQREPAADQHPARQPPPDRPEPAEPGEPAHHGDLADQHPRRPAQPAAHHHHQRRQDHPRRRTCRPAR